MALFRVLDGKGKICEVEKVRGKPVVKLPEDWDCTHVRVYKLKPVTVVK